MVVWWEVGGGEEVVVMVLGGGGGGSSSSIDLTAIMIRLASTRALRLPRRQPLRLAFKPAGTHSAQLSVALSVLSAHTMGGGHCVSLAFKPPC